MTPEQQAWMQVCRDHETGRRLPHPGDVLESRYTRKRATVMGLTRARRLVYVRLSWHDSGRTTERLVGSVARAFTLVSVKE